MCEGFRHTRDAVTFSERREAGTRSPEKQLAETLYERRKAASQALEAIRARSKSGSVADMIRETKEALRFRGDER